MTTAKANCFRANRIRNIVAAGFKACYEIDYTSCEGFWFVCIDGRSYIIGHDGTTDCDMARKANEWVAKLAA